MSRQVSFRFDSSEASKPVSSHPLIQITEGAPGAYCDPLTGECYPSISGEATEHSIPLKLETTMIAIDPVCKMEVEVETARYKSEHAGKTYYFCSAGCQRSFEKDPHQYLPEEHHGHGHDHESHSHS